MTTYCLEGRRKMSDRIRLQNESSKTYRLEVERVGDMSGYGYSYKKWRTGWR